jgi:hypothetical protein
LLSVTPPPASDPAAAPAPVAAAVPFGCNTATSEILSSPVASIAAAMSFSSLDKGTPLFESMMSHQYACRRAWPVS